MESIQLHPHTRPKALELAACRRTAQRTSLLAMILCAAAVQLFHVSHETTGGCNTFRFASYAAMFFNAFAAVASLILLDRVEDVRLNDEGKDRRPVSQVSVPPSSRWQLILGVGSHPNLKYVFIQWMLCLFLGTVFFLMQTLAYIGYTRPADIGAAIRRISP
ncbi:hypothetical protein K438DRAFT_358428 [Mycena galopus ATCC 62051]|nr:hypothetical protein K438DRAFT_587377 [Mycena galopus ATCC 62051]KAF8155245.1 hypothetical protein K438DRAFT_358428 [Mycena galopus ATCC 62051]